MMSWSPLARRLALTALLAVAPGAVLAQLLIGMSEITIEGMLRGKGDRASQDVSGMACQAQNATGVRECLLIDDERRAAQRVRLNGRRLIAGEDVDLIGTAAPIDAAGTTPTVACAGGNADWGEFDGEAVALGPAHFYLVGSHGCGRSKDTFRASSFLVARVPLDSAQPIQRSWRLTELLRAQGRISEFVGRRLHGENGLNIEGAAIMNDRLLLGLRAPSIDDRAFVLDIDADALFAPGASPPSAARLHRIRLGEDIGIRDLAPLPDGRLLILAGPAQEQALPYRLLAVRLPATGSNIALTELGALPTFSGAKPEAVTVLGLDDGVLRILVLADGLPNGGPIELNVPFPATQ
jgi:hypothetical protein